MTNRSHRHVPRNSDQAGQRRRGGQELPDDVQDRPEQNAGYDAAVRQGPAGHRAAQPFLDMDLLDLDLGADQRQARHDERAEERKREEAVDAAERAAPADPGRSPHRRA